VLGEKILGRSKRSGVIITGSQFGEYASSGFLSYGASKSFAKFVGQGLNFEWKDKADVLTICPGEVATNMNPGKPNALKIVPKKITAAALRDIGRVSWSYGNIMHDFPFRAMMCAPTKRI
jgi:short-subunit dehydrogenase